MTTLTPEKEAELDAYDAGLLNDYGGGNVEWWQDYIRAELANAYGHYAEQVPGLLATERQARADAEKEVERLSARVQALEQVAVGPLSYTAMRAAKDAAEAKDAALVEVLAPFAAIYAEARRDFHDGSKRPELDLSKEAWGFNNAAVKWADFHRAHEALTALPPPVPTEEAETVLREDAQGRLREVAVPTEEGAEDKTCFMCHGKGRHEPIVAWPAVSEIEDKLRRDDLPDSVLCSQCSGTGKLPTQAPQDVAGLVEEAARIIDPALAVLHDKGHLNQWGHENWQALLMKANAILALRTSPISHESKGLELAAADNNREAEIPDFLKRQTGELPPATFPTWGEDDGREGRRLGAEEDPDNNHKALVRALDFRALANRFLGWPVPSSVRSDRCMTMTHAEYPHGRNGTSMMGPDEAENMLRYVLSAVQAAT